MSLLAIDVGNSSTVLALFEGDGVINHWRLATDDERLVDGLRACLRSVLESRASIPVAIASVVPRVGAVVEELCGNEFNVAPLLINGDMDIGVELLYEPRAALGADRVANIAAAHAHYGGPCIVMDAGTATKFEAITGDGRYLGGAIAPGIVISADALFRSAALLPRVPLNAPPDPVGRNTGECIQSGIIYGAAAMAEGMITRFRARLGSEATVVATGGLAGLISPHTDCITHLDPFLTVRGIRQIYQRLRGDAVQTPRSSS